VAINGFLPGRTMILVMGFTFKECPETGFQWNLSTFFKEITNGENSPPIKFVG
jgi:hypothetical protein